ncbi:hypothetical protein [Croceicoccus naphthovorans]|uniref:hypothetical protein n=1 Tax=Croceicoccus naphthovorans TaxID=1348774 RepID=UPI00069E1151|nr:hypothetical protein [Croceicoccus naphthovorans]MBB3989118.1 hypothetical protein [Croceicoccus naphthovorans]
MRLTVPARAALAAASLLALAACGDTSEPDPLPTETPMPVEPDGGIGDGAGPPGGDATDEMEQTIPAGLQGRWGMTTNDCDASRSDGKGLLTVGSQSLTFYESVGTLASVAERDASHIVASFDWEWTRTETLRLVGATLTRSTNGGDGSGGPFEYERCT